jgi:hypothetical protein
VIEVDSTTPMPDHSLGRKPRKRAGHALVPDGEVVEVPHRTEIGERAEIKWRSRLEQEIEGADVASFAKGINRRFQSST